MLIVSPADAGWQSLLIVTGHGGNRPALTLAQQEILSHRPDLRFAWAPVTPHSAWAGRHRPAHAECEQGGSPSGGAPRVDA